MVPDEDAAFILELLNDPSFIANIGDRGVRSLDDARAYIRDGPVASYERFGFGLWLVELTDGTRIGMCGLLKRDTLEDVDIGFAYLPAYQSQGYGFEAARAVLDYARDVLGISRVVAIVSEGNDASARLLEKLGMTFELMVQPSLRLFGVRS
jgi:RimJ/RimL family protein N-acetyltransferase